MLPSDINRLQIFNLLLTMTTCALNQYNIFRCCDLNYSGSETVKRNSSISQLYIYYQMFTVSSSILGPASVTLMIAGRSSLLPPCPYSLHPYTVLSHLVQHASIRSESFCMYMKLKTENNVWAGRYVENQILQYF